MRSTPSERWRDTHSQSDTIMSISPASMRDIGRVLAGEIDDLEIDAVRGVESMMLQRVELPAHCAELEDADADLGGGKRAALRRNAINAPSAASRNVLRREIIMTFLPKPERRSDAQISSFLAGKCAFPAHDLEGRMLFGPFRDLGWAPGTCIASGSRGSRNRGARPGTGRGWRPGKPSRRDQPYSFGTRRRLARRSPPIPPSVARSWIGRFMTS